MSSDRQHAQNQCSSTYDERPFIVIWEATRACDLVCQHCRAEAQPFPDEEELSTREAQALLQHVREEFGPVLLVITGGDPLKRDDVEDLIRFGDGIGLRMAITPSATPLLSEDAIERLQAAGVKRMALSLDGADAETHDAFRGVERTFERTCAAFRHARAIGLETQMNSSITKANWPQLRAMADLAGDFGVSLWSVFILVPTGRADEDMLMSAVEHEKVYQELAEIAGDPQTTFDVKTTAGQPYYRVREQARRRWVNQGREFKADWSNGRAPAPVNDGKGFVFINHVGDIQPSGFLPLTCGNVRTDALSSVYRYNPIFKRLRLPDAYAGKCGVCEYQEDCGGSRSRTYALTGDPFDSDPTCVYHPKQREPEGG